MCYVSKKFKKYDENSFKIRIKTENSLTPLVHNAHILLTDRGLNEHVNRFAPSVIHVFPNLYKA